MPTPPLKPGHPEWPNVEKAWRVYHDEWGEKIGAVKAAAEAVGRSPKTVGPWLNAYRRHAALDPALSESMDAVGTGLVPRLAWAKTKTRKDGTQTTDYSVLLKPDPLPDDALRRIREAFEEMEPAEPVTPPDRVIDSLMAVWPVMDMHFGMHAWGRETGGPDYDVNQAKSDLQYATEKVLALTPATREAVLILGGDTLHADDTTSQTPRSGHALDTDGRHYRVVEHAIQAVGFLIERLLSRCGTLTVRVLRGNHDEHSHMVLAFAIAERFRRDARLTVEKDPRDLFMKQWGNVAVFSHHGDKAKPEQMALQLADVCPFWSACRHRYALTGHVHHHQAKDIGGLRWESLRAFCPPDSYAAGMGYTSRRAMQALIFDRQDGLVLRATDPIERLAG